MTNLETHMEDLTAFANSKLSGADFTCCSLFPSFKNKKGEIKAISKYMKNGDRFDLIAECAISDMQKSFVVSNFAAGLLTICPEYENAMVEVFEQLEAVNAELAKQLAQEKADREEARRAEREAKEAAIQEEKLKLRRISDIKQAERLLMKATTTNRTENDFFVSLGYLAKHIKKLSANMPDYLEPWFIKTFGDNTENKRVVDSKKVGAAGFTSQWSLSIQADLDSNENMPAYLSKYLSVSKKAIKPISNTEFLFELICQYGFKYGKKQELTEILRSIPDGNKADFEVGYAL